jgi:hypothetical protein
LAQSRTSFKKGASGNPKGRPVGSGKPADVIEMCRALTPEAVQALYQALSNPRERVQAATALLDRGWGRPHQSVYAQVDTNLIVGGIDAPPLPQTLESAEEWLIRRRKELAALEAPTITLDATLSSDSDSTH